MDDGTGTNGTARGIRWQRCGLVPDLSDRVCKRKTGEPKTTSPPVLEPTGKINSQWKRYCRENRLWWMLTLLTTPSE